jgi:catechol 2,3-dioxygenase-like lactoylglutathione lyase family enzyme
MAITSISPQLRTTDIASSIRFYTEKLGFSVEFNYEDFYVGIRAGGQLIHLKLVDQPDPSIPYVDDGGHLHLYIGIEGVHETPWSTREVVVHDDQGHTLYFGEPL